MTELIVCVDLETNDTVFRVPLELWKEKLVPIMDSIFESAEVGTGVILTVSTVGSGIFKNLINDEGRVT